MGSEVVWSGIGGTGAEGMGTAWAAGTEGVEAVGGAGGGGTCGGWGNICWDRAGMAVVARVGAPGSRPEGDGEMVRALTLGAYAPTAPGKRPGVAGAGI